MGIKTDKQFPNPTVELSERQELSNNVTITVPTVEINSKSFQNKKCNNIQCSNGKCFCMT